MTTSTMRAATRLALLVALLLPPLRAAALDLDIPPYLQMTTPTSVCVRWRTDSNSDSLLEYGSSPTSLTESEYDATSETDHELCPSGLTPGQTRYYYRVGATGDPLAGGDSDHYFETSLATGSEESVRIWFISDLHTVGARWEATLASYIAFTAGNKADVIITGGDNFGNDGLDSEAETTLNALEEVSRNTPIFFSPGNHDWQTGSDPALETGPWYDLLTLPDAAQAGGVSSGTENYYSFDYGNVHFVALDHDGSGTGGSGNDHYDWAESDLTANTQEWTIVYGHIPPYSKCKRDSDDDPESTGVRETWLPMMEPLGFDLMLNGHMHCYQRTFFINGHHGDADTFDADTHVVEPGSGGCCGAYYTKVGGGPVANGGAVYMIACSVSMQQGDPAGTWDLPAAWLTVDGDSATAGAPARQQSVVIDIQDQLMDVHVIRQNGQQVDAFQIRKADP